MTSFNVFRVDVHATGENHVFQAIHDVQESFFVGFSQITGVKPSVFPCSFSGLFVSAVSVKQCWSPRDNFTDFAGLNVFSHLVDDSKLHIEKRLSGAADFRS